MGVRGLTTLLQKRGIIPSNTTRGHESNNTSCTKQIEIKPNANLAIDGSSLAFHIFRLAYYKHYQYITGNDRRDDFRDDAHLILNLLPSFVPLSIIELTTKEILLKFLYTYKVNVRIYLDGSKRILKQGSDKLRADKRHRLDENLHHFITTKILPNSFKNSSKIPEADLFLDEFPFPVLWFDQIMYCFFLMEHKISLGEVDTLYYFQVIRCPDEADRFVAIASAIDVTNNTFAIGIDSDYLLYGFPKEYYGWFVGDLNVQYIPLDLLEMGETAPILKGILLTRQKVAKALRVSENILLEASILMGNDHTKTYVDSYDLMQGTNYFADFCEAGDYLLSYDVIDSFVGTNDKYRITSADKDFQLSIDFTRDLFSFKDISQYHAGRKNLCNKIGIDSSEGAFKKFSTGDMKINYSQAILEVQNMSQSDDSWITLKDQVLSSFVDINSSYRNKKLTLFALQESLELSNTLSATYELVPYGLKWETILLSYQLAISIKVVLKARMEKGILPSDEFSPYKIFHPAFLYQRLDISVAEDDNAYCGQEKTKLIPLNNPCVSGKNEAEPRIDVSIHSPLQSRQALPIDDFKNEIISHVQENQITVIQGETGCGKSSRVPVMLLEIPPPDPNLVQVKMFICQPRRIAAKSLTERVRSTEPHLRDLIGLRMGMGVKEYETSKTRAWFCTTGYLTRRLSKHPNSFRDCTHLIIDEVHERSIDTDILCLLARRLLICFPHIRLILMSATIAAEIYCDYFNVSQEPIFVGRRCYPIREYFLEDIAREFQFGSNEKSIIEEIETKCLATKCKVAPNAYYMEILRALIIQIALIVGSNESSVLIFVPGMSDIISIIESLDGFVAVGRKFICIPIHSDIPFDEQLSAFQPVSKGEVKIIVATNAAESSVTIPDVDHVICTGLCKQIVYNEKRHRQMLECAWISKASATQRSGRTGRIRPGNVYRLYPKVAYDKYLAPFEVGEILRSPLDAVVLNLRTIISNEDITKILLDCIEPPKIENIQRSLNSLHNSGFIDQPVEEFSITASGDFVLLLGIDFTLGALIGLGIALNVTAAAIEIANVLSFSQSPWRTPNSLMQEPKVYNDIASKSQKSMARFDANLFSEPMATVNLLYEFEHCTESKSSFCQRFSVSHPRMKRLLANRNNLRNRVAIALGVNVTDLYLKIPLSNMSHLAITLLRFINVFLFHDNLVQMKVRKDKKKDVILNDSISLEISGDLIKEHHLHQILDKDRHPFNLKTYRNTTIIGSFQPIVIDDNFINIDMNDLEDRMLSLAKARRFNLIFSYFEQKISIYVPGTRQDEFVSFLEERYSLETIFLCRKNQEHSQGWTWRNRNCGMFSLERYNDFEQQGNNENVMLKYSFAYGNADYPKKALSNVFKKLKKKAKMILNKFNILFINISERNVNGGETALDVEAYGDFDSISDQDMKDLLGTPDVCLHIIEGTPMQTLILNPTPHELAYSSKSSCQKPFLQHAHEGYGIVSAVASLQRNKPGIYFHGDGEEISQNCVYKMPDNVEIFIKDSRVKDRWSQFPSGDPLFLNTNNFPSTIFPVEDKSVFACCANSLLLRGDMIKVEGMTILPPDDLFVPLAMRCIGVNHNQIAGLAIPSESKDLADLFYKSFHGFDSLTYQPHAVKLLRNIFNLNDEKYSQDDEDEVITTKIGKKSNEKENHEGTCVNYIAEKMGQNIPPCFLDLFTDALSQP